MQSGIKIEYYEEWMKPQVAGLFENEYKINKAEFESYFSKFYEHSFQENKCIRIVALDTDKVIGFQSFFYWPYVFQEKEFVSYQSGNSLVHSDYRGKGVFQKLLYYLDLHKEELKIDFLIGFPIDVSIGSLLRNKWVNLFNLQWYIKPISPLSFIFPLDTKKLKKHFPNRNLFVKNQSEIDFIKISNATEFVDWRNTYNEDEKQYSFYYSNSNNELLLKLKVNIRKYIIKEFIIGDIISTSYETSFLENAFIAFYKEVKKTKCISLISIAINEYYANSVKTALLNLNFKKINKQIFFCIKPFLNDELIMAKDKWMVYRGDIDTW